VELFRLFGSIFVDNDEANKSIAKTDDNAKKTSGTFTNMIGTVGKWGVAIGTAAGAAALALGTLAVNAADDLKKSLNGLEAATGINKDKMGEMRQAMLDIYNNNFGESFEDIGRAMTTISQQTGLSGQALADMTKNAIAVKDTFDFEVNESMRAANMLIKQFGMTGEEAYNMIVQGAQNGLDKNGDLLDTINEYSVHFQQLGFGSEEMFNMLVNGAESGTFSVDKLGDSIKEFGIRVKDNSDTTKLAFSTLGLDAAAITNQFASGGAAANNAFQSVIQKLLEMKDPIAQNTAGVALFGTMWEDLGVKGIAALTSTEGEINKNVNALEKINAVKYDTFGEAVAGIKRQLETSILIPLGDKILPILNKFAAWINENMPAIKQYISVAMDEASKAFYKVYDVISAEVMPIFDALKLVFDYYVQEYVPLLVGAFQEWIPRIYEVFQAVWDILKPLLDTWLAAFNLVFPTIKDIVSNTIKAITGIVSGLLKTLEGIIIFLTGVFTGNWQKAWEGVVKIFEGVFKTMSATIKGVLNELIILVNTMIRGLNKLSFSFPSWIPGMGGKSFSLNIPEIPKLAKGGNILDDGAVMVGENGPEVLSGVKGARVTPLDRTSKTVNIYITGNSIMSDRDADIFGELIVGRLKMLGVT
jgi:phage-related minor tail protein